MNYLHQLVADIQGLTILEIIAVISAVVYVVLAWREKVACWAFGILSSLIFMYISVKVNYKLEAFLYLFYVAMGIFGWWEWSKGLEKVEDKAVVKSLSKKNNIVIIATGIVFSIVLGYLFDNYFGSSLAYLDATTTVFAIIATWMTTRKILENWLYWIVIDFLSIYLYIDKELYFASFLYVVYIVIAFAGYFAWLKSYRVSKELKK